MSKLDFGAGRWDKAPPKHYKHYPKLKAHFWLLGGEKWFAICGKDLEKPEPSPPSYFTSPTLFQIWQRTGQLCVTCLKLIELAYERGVVKL